MNMIKLNGGCHCGAVSFEIISPISADMLDCNCSICSASGYIHHFIPHDNFTLLTGKDMLTSYRFGSGEADHLFCKKCGVKSFYQPRSHPDCYSINLNILQGSEKIETNIIPFNGRNWEESKSKLAQS